ncbi:SDR family NAD(P)-dependent oxidoreductase [Castellaniella sp.]|uniref:SDR family NAD(P)-dependent oxidoreductase n=1 Tax=Castellaniella sp. TaxID=1955812 RepID=UPI00356A3778
MNNTNEGKVVLVTGGVSGIGLALVRGLLAKGWQVLAVDVQAGQIEAARQAFGDAFGGQLRFAQADVTDETRIEQVVADCEADFGPLHGLVHSAGIAAEIPAMETDVAMFRRIMDVNVTGSFITARAAARVMQPRGTGSIVLISSVSGMRGNYGRVAYGSSKSALLNMTRIMAVEWARSGLRVNTVAPGPIDTPLTKKIHTPATRANWNRVVAMGRYGADHELVGPVCWLLDPDGSSYVTGQVIAVDGGFTAMGLPVPDA